jgi:hypothetical protein
MKKTNLNIKYYVAHVKKDRNEQKKIELNYNSKNEWKKAYSNYYYYYQSIMK